MHPTLQTLQLFAAAALSLPTSTAHPESPMSTPNAAQQTNEHTQTRPARPAAAPADERTTAAITNAILAIARGADRRDWDEVATAFAETVVLDYGTPERLTPAEIVGRWQPLLEAFDATQHQLSEIAIRVTGDRATATSRFLATHSFAGAGDEGDVWSLEGRYEHDLTRDAAGHWHVARMRMIPGASTGNTALLALAQARAASREAARAASPAANGHHAVRVERVTFTSGGERMVGNLYLPADVPGGTTLPAAVVTGAWMTVKEQMPGRYARELARRGFAALAFDFRHWGESGGALRQREVPAEKIADIRAAATFLATRPEIDATRIGALGVCASAGYMAAAVATDPLFRAVAFVAPWFHDAEIVRTVYGGEGGVQRLIATGRDAAAQHARTAMPQLATAASLTDSTAVMFGVPYYTEPARGQLPAWRNQVDLAFWEGWLTFDGIAASRRLTQPTLVVHSEAAVIPQGAHRFVAQLAAPHKSEQWLDGVSQFDFYDQDRPVGEASELVAAHLTRHLAPDAPMVDAHAVERARNRLAVERFFHALELKDLTAFLDVWADDGVQIMPFAPKNFPARLEGKAAIREQYGSLPENYRYMRFPREITPMQDPARFVVRYTGQIGLANGGRYDNTYVGLFTVRNGQVQEFVEFFDPIVLQSAFGAALQQNFNAGR
jgi:ketosteroid isomerase-like protein/fermentation-respiration switch protein FrsA (DUF1100 family)